MFVMIIVLIYYYLIGGSVWGLCNEDLNIISRNEWKARSPKNKTIPMKNPVPFIVIHHSYIPKACYNFNDCSKSMRNMQDNHQLHRKWNDIGYNFAIGSDGYIYKGRGWSTVGAHAPLYNNRSIGICLIGDWRSQLPPTQQLESTLKLIQCEIESGMIHNNYKLIGHRQVKNTECPGDKLFIEISTWKHFCNQTL